MAKSPAALLGLLLPLSACASGERDTFAEPRSPDLPAAASDYAADIPTSDEPETPRL